MPGGGRGVISGLLTASGRGQPIPPARFERLQSLGSGAELALDNTFAHHRLEEQALTDPLTGLANRRELEHAFLRLPDRLPFAVVAMDLDHLKHINDRFGHPTGDAAIVAVAAAITSVTRRGDTVARVGGDEFTVLMLDATQEAVMKFTTRVHAALEGLSMVSGTPRVSIGACVAAPGSDTGLVQGTADAALYGAKHGGGAQTVTCVFEQMQPPLLA